MRHNLQIFILAAIGVSTAAVATPLTTAEETEFERVLTTALAEFMRTGPQESDWNRGGADIDAIVAAKSGGAAANYVLTVDKDRERSVVVYSAAKPWNLIPKEWDLVSEVGALETGATAGPVVFEELEDGFAFVIQGTERRNGDAFCADKFQGARLYSTGKAATTELPSEVIEMIFKAAVELFRDKPVCARYVPNEGIFGVRYYLPDGRSLPTMDSYREVITIVPAAPIATLLSVDEAD